MKNMKKFMALALALVMVFALSANAFAVETATTASVTLVMPEFYTGEDFEPVETTHTGYTYACEGIDPMLGAVDLYSYTTQVNYSSITNWTVTPPTDFQGLYNYNTAVYTPTAFDVIYKGVVNNKGESTSEYPATTGQFVYGFASPAYYESGSGAYIRADGIFVNRISGLAATMIDSDYESYWVGYDWALYAVPSGANFDIADHDDLYLTDLYANNIPAQDGYTYYMIYEYTEINF